MTVIEQLVEIKNRHELNDSLEHWVDIVLFDRSNLLTIIKGDREILKEIVQLFESVKSRDYNAMSMMERGTYLGYQDAALKARNRLQE